MGHAAADHVTPETEPTCTIAVLDFSHTKDVHGVAAVSSSTSIAGRLCRLPPSFLRSASKPEGESVEVHVRSPTARAVRRGRAANRSFVRAEASRAAAGTGDAGGDPDDIGGRGGERAAIAKYASARCLRSMRRAWRAMAVIGTRLPRRQASRRIVRRWTLPFRGAAAYSPDATSFCSLCCGASSTTSPSIKPASTGDTPAAIALSC
jgi:hypothetical protein